MINQELIEYVRQHREAGFGDDAIRQELVNAGWPEEDIGAAMGEYAVESHALKSLPELLKESWHIYTRRFWKLLGIGSIFMLAPLAVFGIIFGTVALSLFWKLVVSSIALLCLIPILWWSQAALLYAARSDTEVGWRDAFRNSRHRFWPFGWTFILTYVFIFGIGILAFIPVIISLFLVNHSLLLNTALLVIAVWIVILPLEILFGLFFSLAPIISLFEDVRGLRALSRSRFYSKGRRWKFLFLLAVPMGVIIGPEVILELLNTNIFNIVRIVYQIIALIIAPLIVVYMVQVYFSLKQSAGIPPQSTDKLVKILFGIFISAVVIPIAGFMWFIWRVQQSIPPGVQTTNGIKTYYTVDIGKFSGIPNGNQLAYSIYVYKNDGYSDSQIRQALASGGVQPQDINTAFSALIPSQWRTYTNTEYQFTVDYPQDWHVEKVIGKPFIVWFGPDQQPQWQIDIIPKTQTSLIDLKKYNANSEYERNGILFLVIDPGKTNVSIDDTFFIFENSLQSASGSFTNNFSGIPAQ